MSSLEQAFSSKGDHRGGGASPRGLMADLSAEEIRAKIAELGERFDVVIFMGVLYHLRHPLLARGGDAPEFRVFNSRSTRARGFYLQAPGVFARRA